MFKGALLGLLLAALGAVPCRGAAVCGSTFSAHTTLASGTAAHVRSLAYAESGGAGLLISGGEDMMLRVWDVSPIISTTPRVYARHQETIWALEWISELNVVASACGDGIIRLWPFSVLAAAQSCPNVGENCCDGDGLGCRGEYLLHWHAFGSSMLKRRQCHSLEWISNGDGTGTLLSGWGDGSIRRWLYDGSTWAYSNNLQDMTGWDITDRTYDMVWLSGSSVLATASPDWPHPRLWTDLTTVGQFVYLKRKLGEDECPSVVEHCDAVMAIVTNAAGTKVASGSKDNSVILWDAATYTKYAKLTSHTDWVTSLVWLHSEDKLASGSLDSTVMIWDATVTADTSTVVQTLTGHAGSVEALVWIPGLKMLASADSSGNVKLWGCT